MQYLLSIGPAVLASYTLKIPGQLSLFESAGMHTPYSINFVTGGNFNGYCLFKYLTENILTDSHCLSQYNCKRCIVFKQFDRLNFYALAGKCQKRQNFPPHQHFVLYGTL